MCTVTVVPFDEGVRLVCNRDERRTRTPALPPRRANLGSRWLAHPVDPGGGGTWIGVNSSGVALVLLNRTCASDDVMEDRPRCSRGLVIPPLLGYERIDDAMTSAMRVDPRRHLPFRLVGVQGDEAVVVTSDGNASWVHRLCIDGPLLFTSSSLGDDLAEAARRPLFERLVIRAHDSRLDGQRRFHEHRWPQAMALSVLMSRPDARTVSRSTIDVGDGEARLAYEALDEPPGVANAAEWWGVAC